MGGVKRCPICGATSTTDDAFCELDGSRLEGNRARSRPRCRALRSRLCPSCGEGTIEPDGFCSVCGKRFEPPPETVRSFPPMGAKLAGGVVIGTPSPSENVVRLGDGTTALVVLGEMSELEREASALERAGSDSAFPRVVGVGVDDAYGAYLALATRDDARPIAEAAPAMTLREAVAVARELVVAAEIAERLGLSWEPSRDDVRVRKRRQARSLPTPDSPPSRARRANRCAGHRRGRRPRLSPRARARRSRFRPHARRSAASPAPAAAARRRPRRRREHDR